MRAALSLLGATAWFVATLAQAGDAAPIGTVKVVEGSVTIARGSGSVAAIVGTRLLADDRLRTGTASRVGVTLEDDTRVSLGPDSELVLDEFAFDPAAGRLGMVMRLLRGIAAFASGEIARLAPESVRLETPRASLGIRGTRFVADAGQP